MTSRTGSEEVARLRIYASPLSYCGIQALYQHEHHTRIGRQMLEQLGEHCQPIRQCQRSGMTEHPLASTILAQGVLSGDGGFCNNFDSAYRLASTLTTDIHGWVASPPIYCAEDPARAKQECAELCYK